MNAPKRVAIYGRVSTKDKQDLETQWIPLKKFIVDRGWTLVGQYEDKESGAKENRAGLLTLMDDARKGKFQAVVVFRFDRFGRSTRQLLSALEEFKQLGIDFISLSESIDTSNPTGKILFTLISAFSEFERSIIQSRIRSGISKCRALNIRLGRPPITSETKVKVLELRGKCSIREISLQTGVSIASVKRIFKGGSKTSLPTKNEPEIGLKI